MRQDRQVGQGLGCRRSIDLPEEPDRSGLERLGHREDPADRRNSSGVGHLRQGGLGLVTFCVRGRGRGQHQPMLFEERLPFLVGLLLSFGLGFLGLKLGIGGPSVAMLAVAETFPGVGPRRVEPGRGGQVSPSLILEAVLVGPDAER